MSDGTTTLLQAPPDVRTIVYRTHCLGALVQRWEFEQTIQGFDELSIVEIHRGMVADMGNWIDKEGMAPYLLNKERELLDQSIGHWSREAVDSVGWQTEALGIFTWALSLTKTLPAYDCRVSHDDLLMYLRIGKPLQPILAKVRLRPIEQLQQAGEAAALWRWRAQTSKILDNPGALPANVNLPEFIASTASTACEKGILSKIIDGDFAAFGRPYREASADQTTLLAAIADERARAFQWLLGSTPSPAP